MTSSELPWAAAQPDSLRHRRLRMTGTQPHARRGAAGRGPNWDSGPCAGHAGAARRCTKRHRRLWAQPGPRACTGRGSYASTHAHFGTAGRETLWGPRAASGPEELRDSERSHVIDRMRHWSIIGSVGPLHGPGR
jgi:hypothetical protein